MMAFQNNFVATILKDNKSLREINKDNKRTCLLDFGSEYKIRLKNKKSFRCMVEVDIDGTDVLFGKRLILQPGETLDLERFLTDNNSGKKFKFASLKQAAASGQLQDPFSEDNGHIKIKVYGEVTSAIYTNYIYCNSTPTSGIHYKGCNSAENINTNSNYFTTSSISNSNISGCDDVSFSSSCSLDGTLSCNNPLNESLNVDKGVTVEGAISNQKFTNGDWFATVTYPEIIDIWLSGNNKAKEIKDIPNSAKFILDTYINPALSSTSSAEKREEALKWLPLFIESLKN